MKYSPFVSCCRPGIELLAALKRCNVSQPSPPVRCSSSRESLAVLFFTANEHLTHLDRSRPRWFALNRETVYEAAVKATLFRRISSS